MNIIEKYRKIRGVSVDDLCRYANYSTGSYYNNRNKDFINYKMEEVVKFCDYLEIPLEEYAREIRKRF